MNLDRSESTMEAVRSLVARVARSNISVLVDGETGVGKEVMAETIHRLSPRAGMPLARLNCAALSESLIESELFGHERGAFTGAFQSKAGLLEAANGGTVFLDEIGELPLATQVKLLRVVEDRRVQRIGSLTTRQLDVRFVAATNRDLLAEVTRGTFREDLYFRLNGITLTIPPLRERRAEIRSLAELFLSRVCAEHGLAPLQLSADALAKLLEHAWPGNIRELKHVIERAAVLCDGDAIMPQHLALRSAALRTVAVAAGETLDFKAGARDRERSRIISALSATDGNQSRAAEMLGMSRRAFVSKLDLHDLPRPRKQASRVRGNRADVVQCMRIDREPDASANSVHHVTSRSSERHAS